MLLPSNGWACGFQPSFGATPGEATGVPARLVVLRLTAGMQACVHRTLFLHAFLGKLHTTGP